jgi:hypothetical protein
MEEGGVIIGRESRRRRWDHAINRGEEEEEEAKGRGDRHREWWL